MQVKSLTIVPECNPVAIATATGQWRTEICQVYKFSQKIICLFVANTVLFRQLPWLRVQMVKQCSGILHIYIKLLSHSQLQM